MTLTEAQNAVRSKYGLGPLDPCPSCERERHPGLTCDGKTTGQVIAAIWPDVKLATTGRDALVEWAQPEGSVRFSSIPRCGQSQNHSLPAILDISDEWEARVNRREGRSLLAIEDDLADAVQARQRRVTHGRHCPCSSCARQDWTDPKLAHCGMHGPSCPAVYAPAESVR